MEVERIIRDFLVKNNYDGLYNQNGECACQLEDLFPCAPKGFSLDCKAGHFVNCPEHFDEDMDWCIGNKEED